MQHLQSILESKFSQDLISGTIANTIISIITYTGSRSCDTLKQLFCQESNIDKILKKSIISQVNTLEFDDEQFAENLRSFLSSPDIESIFRQIYANKLTPERNTIVSEGEAIDITVDHTSDIKAEFLACLSLHLDINQQRLIEFSDSLFELLLESCETALMEAINKGQLFAHEAKSSLRYNMLANELATINKNLDFLNSKNKPNIQEIIKFERKYLQQVIARYGYVIPPYFGVAQKIPINKIFVDPSFISFNKKNRLTIKDFLSVSYRAVILGNPGAGKSTFALKFCHDLATNYDKRIFSGRQVIPILVILRDYGVYKKSNNSSILEFIEKTSNSNHQIKPPTGAFEYLFLNGHAIIIFDGLDELIETRYRQEISSDIESFCTLYPSVPVIVTSREVGYNQAPLNENFDILHLASFNEDQIREYTAKWFAIDTDLPPEQQKQKENSFLRESQIVPDLRSNPLLLSLMCNIYRGENYIPKNRPDVYEKCSWMLFENWDKSRGIKYELPFEAHIKPTMMFLAYWIYSNEKLNGGVTEKDLIDKTTEYLCPRRLEDYDEAKQASMKFIEFCRGRAWVFTDIGTNKDGERLYQFTHRTFLEYFTASYLVRTCSTPFKLIDLLENKIAKEEWDIVSQLSFQLQSRNIENAGDELLGILIDKIKKSAEDEMFNNPSDFTDGSRTRSSYEMWNTLSFIVRCLEFMVPSPEIVKKITSLWFELNMASYLENAKREMTSSGKLSLFKYGKFVADLLYVSTDNRKTVVNTLKELINFTVIYKSELEAVLALEIGLCFSSISSNDESKISESRLDNKVLEYWRVFSNSIFETFSERIISLSPKYLCLCDESFRRGKVSVINLVKWYGFKSIFSSCNKFPSPAETLMEYIQFYPYRGDKTQFLSDLEELSMILLSSSTEWWIKGHNIHSSFRLREISQVCTKSTEDLLNLNSNALFSAFALFAATLENEEEIQRLETINWIKESQNPFFDRIGLLLVARFSKVEIYKIQENIDLCGFTAKQYSFIWQWIRQEINFVRI